MLILPIILLLITVILIWIFRKKHLRSHWFLASFGILLAWVATYLLGDQIPIEVEFSIWAPNTLFSTPLLFEMDEISWPLVMTCLAVSLALSLTLPSRDIVITMQERLSSIIYLCLALGAILAGNMLSVITAWMLMDVFIFALAMWGMNREKNGSEIVRWFAKNLIAIFFLLIATILDISKGGNPNFREQMIDASIFLVIISVSLRMPVLSISSYGKKIGWSDSGNKLVLDVFPALTGFSVLGHVLSSGISAEPVLWLSLIGCSLLIYSIVHSFFWTETRIPWIGSYMGMLGISILVSTYGSSQIGIMISVIGVLIASLNTSLKLIPIHESWHTVVPVLFIAMFAGLPGTPGSLLGSRTANEIINAGDLGRAFIVWIGMGVLSASYIKKAVLSPQDWKNSENLTRISYALGMMLLVCNAVFIGIEMKRDVTLAELVFFLSVCLLAGLVYYGTTKLRHLLRGQLFEMVRIPHLKLQNNFINMIGQIFTDIFLGIGRLFESEIGMLWAFVILLMLILALGNIGI